MAQCLGPKGHCAPCATLSMLTCYRTSRSLHFPFWAVCSLSDPNRRFGLSVGTHQYLDSFSVVRCSSQSTSFVVSPAGGRGGPGLLWPGPLGPIRPNMVAKTVCTGSAAGSLSGPHGLQWKAALQMDSLWNRWFRRQRPHAHAPEVAPARFWTRFPSHWFHGIVRYLEGCDVPHRSIRE